MVKERDNEILVVFQITVWIQKFLRDFLSLFSISSIGGVWRRYALFESPY